MSSVYLPGSLKSGQPLLVRKKLQGFEKFESEILDILYLHAKVKRLSVFSCPSIRSVKITEAHRRSNLFPKQILHSFIISITYDMLAIANGREDNDKRRIFDTICLITAPLIIFKTFATILKLLK